MFGGNLDPISLRGLGYGRFDDDGPTWRFLFFYFLHKPTFEFQVREVLTKSGLALGDWHWERRPGTTRAQAASERTPVAFGSPRPPWPRGSGAPSSGSARLSRATGAMAHVHVHIPRVAMPTRSCICHARHLPVPTRPNRPRGGERRRTREAESEAERERPCARAVLRSNFFPPLPVAVAVGAGGCCRLGLGRLGR